VEAHNFDIRKNVLEYDDVANDQRKVVYSQRNEVMESDDISETITIIREDVVDSSISAHIAPGSMPEQWNVKALEDALEHEFGLRLPIQNWLDSDTSLHEETLRERIHKALNDAYLEKENQIGSPQMRRLEKMVMLQVLDSQWKEHLAAMDYLRQSIGLRGYAQKNPKQEYKREAFEMFSVLLDGIKSEVVRVLLRIRIGREEDLEARRPEPPRRMQFNHPQAQNALNPEDAGQAGGRPQNQPFVRGQKKIGRNDPCFCGSGKKYKHCHGQLS
jgi:preprotein translocase subunit SecA